MMDRIAKSPLLLGAAFLVSALLGAGLYAVIQRVAPGASPDRTRIEKIVHDYIMAHGEILPEALEKAQPKIEAQRAAEDAKRLAEGDKAAATYAAAHRSEIYDPYTGAMQGNPKGDVTISAFLDYNCGYCRASLPAIAELVKRDPNVRIVYREYPVLAESSLLAARWALAAAEQGKFMAFHHALYAAGHVDQTSIEAAASTAGVDGAAAQKVLTAPRIDKELQKNHELAEALGSANATPLWMVGEKKISGMVTYDQLAEAVAAVRKGK